MLRKAWRLLVTKVKVAVRILKRQTTVTLHGVHIDLKHPLISPQLRRFFYDESYEGGEIAKLAQFLESNDVVMEIGAGIGLVSTYCAQRVGGDNVYAYEGNPRMIDKISETYAANGVKPTIENAILGYQTGPVDFFVTEDYWSSSLVERPGSSVRVAVDGRLVNEEIRRVDPSFLIVDIEGGEAMLFEAIDLGNVQKVLIELHPHVIGHERCSAVVRAILNAGFYLNMDNLGDNVFFFDRPAVTLP